MRPKDEEIRRIIRDYIKDFGVTSTEDIANYVGGITGRYPSRTTIANILKEFKYKPVESPQYWKVN